MRKFRLVLLIVSLVFLIGCVDEKKTPKDDKKSAYDFIKKFEKKGENSNFNERLGERKK